MPLSRRDPRTPVPDITLTQCVLGRAEGRRGRRALVDGASGRALTYPRLHSTVHAAAAGLAGAGLRRGEVVGVHLPDTPELVIATYAVIAAGGVATLVRPSAGAEAAARQLTDAGARMLITWPVLLEPALSAAHAAGVERVFAFGDGPGAEPFTRLLQGGGGGGGPVLDPARDLALLPYTRGTCGPPKGIELTHRNAVAALQQLVDAAQIGQGDVVLSGVELSDVVGLTTMVNPALYTGATVITRSGFGRSGLLQALQDHRVTVALLTPAMIEYIVRAPAAARYDLCSLRTVISTGAPLSPLTARALRARLGCTVRQGYGLAEAGGLTHLYLSPEEDALDSVGPALPLTQCRVMGAAGEVIHAAYEPGEVWIRGPGVVRSYTTASAVTVDGWLRTGDAGFTDQHGRLYLVGRTSLSAAPGEPDSAVAGPEALLRGHPAVSDAAVVPVPDPALGVVSHAFVVLRAAASEDELLGYVTGRSAPYERVQAVHVVGQIPRSAAGRIRRRALIERSRLSRRAEPPGTGADEADEQEAGAYEPREQDPGEHLPGEHAEREPDGQATGGSGAVEPGTAPREAGERGE